MCELCLIHSYVAPPKTLTNTNQPSTTVSMGSNITITVEVSADPKPTASWTLNGGNLAAMTIVSLKYVIYTCICIVGESE